VMTTAITSSVAIGLLPDFQQFTDFSSSEFDMLFAWFRNYQLEAELINQICGRWQSHTIQTVELGCGTGNIALQLARRGYWVTGIDRSKDMLAVAMQKARHQGLPLELEVGDLTDPKSLAPHLQRRFDMAYASFSLIFNFYPRIQLNKFFATCSTLLKPQGLLILNGFCVQKTMQDHPHGKYRIRGVNPYNDNTLRTFVRVIYHQPLVTLVFYHCLQCLASVRITMHTLRPYCIQELNRTARRWGFRCLEVIGYPQSGQFQPGVSEEFFLVFKFGGM